MTVHYHGLPLTPFEKLERLTGTHVCISFATARASNVEWALRAAQSVMWDNGAFSAHTKGVPFDAKGFYAWVEPHLGHPHWAVVPDVIGGSVEDQRLLTGEWPFSKSFGAPVWHLHLPLDYLLELSDEWPKVCFGSSAQYWQVGSPAWQRRMDDTFDYISARRKTLPWIHGLRMLGQAGKRWPLASADSTNVAQNWKRDTGCAECKARPLDAVQTPSLWNPRPLQQELA